MVEPDDVLNMKKAISQVLNSEDCQDQDSVSLFEVLSIYHEIKADKKRVKDEIEDKLNKKLKSINPKYSATIQEVINFQKPVHLKLNFRNKITFRLLTLFVLQYEMKINTLLI